MAFLLLLRRIKKKFELVVDIVYLLGGFNLFFKEKPTYYQMFGIWLNKERIENKRMNVVAVGSGIANGSIAPGLAYFEAVCDGKGEAIAMKSQYDTAQQMARNRE